MKKKIFFVILLVIFVIFGAFKKHQFYSINEIDAELINVSLEEQEKQPLEIQGIINEYDSILTAEIKESGTVGAAVAITYKNQIAFLKCFGVKKWGENDSIDENTIFRLASVSKTVTGVLAGILANENIIDLDDKVVDYLPDFRLKNSESTNSITIRNLLSHTSGLVPHAYDDLIEHHMSLENILPRLKQVGLTASPGEIYGYQNVMFSLIDTIMAVKTSKNYGELVKERLFEPYGMTDASTDFQSFKNNPNHAYPHTGGNGRFRPLRLNDRYYSTAPAAGVNASISDMAHFLLALLNQDDSKLNKNVHQMIFAPQVESHLNSRYFRFWDKVDSKEYAIGWRIVGYKGRQVAYHGGYVNGYKAEIAYCEDDDIGIAFLTNSPNVTASKSVPQFLNLIFDYNDHKKILTNAEVNEESTVSSNG